MNLKYKKERIPWSTPLKSALFVLVSRSIIFLIVLALYLYYVFSGYHNLDGLITDRNHLANWILIVVFIAYAIGILARFIPTKLLTLGTQKVFARNYKPAEPNPDAVTYPKKSGAFTVFIVWASFNLIFGILYWTGIINQWILILLALFFGVCDNICVLFFCPFQTFMMKNKCCNSCRIFNWGFPMMCTPLLFVPNIFTKILCLMAFILVVQWEVTLKRHPERFREETNANLKCANCTEKLCSHKKQLQKFLVVRQKNIQNLINLVNEGKNKELKKILEKVETQEKTSKINVK